MVSFRSFRLALSSVFCVAVVGCSDSTGPEPDPLAELEGTWVHVQNADDPSRFYIRAVTIRADGTVDELGVEHATGRLRLLREGAHSIRSVDDARIEVRSLGVPWALRGPKTIAYAVQGNRLTVEDSAGPFLPQREYQRVAPDERVAEPLDAYVACALRGSYFGYDYFENRPFQSDSISKFLPGLAMEQPPASDGDGSELQLTAHSRDLMLGFTLDNVQGPGEYDGIGGGVWSSLTLAAGDTPFVWSTREHDAAVSVEIKEFDRQLGRCSGTFSASLVLHSEPEYTVEVQNGAFRVPLVERQDTNDELKPNP